MKDSSWWYKETWNVDVKVVKDRKPLLGRGELPGWLKDLSQAGRAIALLEGYEDNLCFWRCLAVWKGANPHRSTERARILAQHYYKYESRPQDVRKTSFDELEGVERFLNGGKPLKNWMGIRVYTPNRTVEEEVEWYLWKAPNPKIKKENIMTIGMWGDHAFLIKDMEKLSKTYACRHCAQRFTQANNLQRHNQTCSQGETKVLCFADKVRAPETAWERAMYQSGEASRPAVLWIESESRKRGTYIHHALCGHGGERWLPIDEKKNRAPVDGYEPKTGDVYQYHGCHYHGCPSCYPNRSEKPVNEKTAEELYWATKVRTENLRKQEHRVIEVWSCEIGQQKGELPQKKTKTYPHAILYDFEAYGDKTRRKEPTEALAIESEHVPVSVSIGDTLERAPTHICDKDPKSLVKKFMEELGRRAQKIRRLVREENVPEDMNLLPKAQQQKINDWCNQVPILGFNSGTYDMNLIKEHFVSEVVGGEKKVKVAKKGNKVMFLVTAGARFLDIINYLGPGTNYGKWVKAYGSEAEKSWLPYEWLDSPKKLEYRGLPEYWAWYSKLRKAYVLTPTEWEGCQRKFKEMGMETFGDWLRYYNNLDVGPGLEAFEKMRSFYTEKGIDITKDAASIPGVSLHYLLRGSVERGADLWSPRKEAYDMLKKAVVGGPSLVFTRKHEVGETLIRRGGEKVCRKIVGYDANALYLSTMMQEMPCGKERVVNYTEEHRERAAQLLTHRLKEGKWFGFAEVDIEIPRSLWPKYAEMCPFFINKQVPEEAVPRHMADYMKRTGRTRGDERKLVGALTAEQTLFYSPLLLWYVDHGAEIKKVYRTIDYERGRPFTWFVDEVTAARRTGDADPSKALLADVFKLLGNSAYGKMIEALERQTNVIYTKDEKVVDRVLRSAYYENLTEIGEAHELESRKQRIVIRRPFQVGIAVYQLAKKRMLEFYYDFLDKYVDRSDFELIEMDTDSNYMAISGESLEEVIRPELRAEFEAEKNKWLAHDRWSNREPGIFKSEFEGSRMIALCSKCYFAEEGQKTKLSTKGMTKAQNELTWERFEKALEGTKDMATNRGFRMREGKIVTYEQEELGLSAYYDKRWVCEDGIHTEPLEYHI